MQCASLPLCLTAVVLCLVLVSTPTYAGSNAVESKADKLGGSASVPLRGTTGKSARSLLQLGVQLPLGLSVNIGTQTELNGAPMPQPTPTSHTPMPESNESMPAPGRYIVVLRDLLGVSHLLSVVNSLTRFLGIQVVHQYKTALLGFSVVIPLPLEDTVVTLLRANPLVRAVQQDTISVAQGVPIQAGEVIPHAIRRTGASTSTTTQAGATVSIAVLDSGVDSTHPDLSHVIDAMNCVSPGYTGQDDHGHGSGVLGLLSAKNNGLGIIGTLPGTTVFSIKTVQSNGYAYNSAILCGLDWVRTYAATYNIGVASMSFGEVGSNDNNCGYTNADSKHQAICSLVNAGVAVVVSAGNSNQDISGWVPASYPEVLVVTAMSDWDGQPGSLTPLNAQVSSSCQYTDVDDSIASYTNYGSSTSTNKMIAAPGSCIVTTYPLWKQTGGFTTLSGTSLAVPQVAGALAACLSSGYVCAGKSPAQAYAALISATNSYNAANPGRGYSVPLARAGQRFGPMLSANRDAMLI